MNVFYMYIFVYMYIVYTCMCICVYVHVWVYVYVYTMCVLVPVDQERMSDPLKLRDLSAFSSQLLGLKVCTTMPSLAVRTSHLWENGIYR